MIKLVDMSKTFFFFWLPIRHRDDRKHGWDFAGDYFLESSSTSSSFSCLFIHIKAYWSISFYQLPLLSIKNQLVGLNYDCDYKIINAMGEEFDLEELKTYLIPNDFITKWNIQLGLYIFALIINLISIIPTLLICKSVIRIAVLGKTIALVLIDARYHRIHRCTWGGTSRTSQDVSSIGLEKVLILY